jgi:arylsulfatase A-like enzyme
VFGALLALGLLAQTACHRDEPAPSQPQPAVRPKAPPHAPPANALVAPFYDLAANLDRFHQRDAGLVIPFATENLRLYDLALRDAWGDVSAHGGLPMRPLVGRARLVLPWGGGPAELRLRGAGKLTFAVDGKKRPPVTLTAEGVRVSLGTLAAGERELTFEAKGKPALHRLELASPEATGCAPATRDGATPPASLAGLREYEIALELPGRVALSVTPRGGGEATISIRGEDGQRRTLWQGRASGSSLQLPLGGAAQIAALALESPDCSTSWHGLRLGALGPTPRPGPAKAAPLTAKHVVLLVVDTLRADRLSAITDTRVKTPRLDAALARGGFAFTAHHSSAPSSPPSHTTIHTGLLPRVHGVTGDDAQLAEGSPMISALLAGKGFYAGYVGNNDFAMGRLKKPGKWSDHKAPVFEDKGIDCAPIIERALGLLEAQGENIKAGKRIFLSLLPLEPHVPYRFHEGITERYYPGPYKGMLGKRVTSAHLGRIKSKGLPDAGWQQLRALYDGEVTYFDSCYAALEDGLAKLGLAQDTAIILTSDHGEGMGERGNNTGHAYSLFHELTWVPLLFFGEPFARPRPGAPAGLRRYAHATSNLDLAPTILELLGEPVDPKMQGQSLLPILRGETPWPRAIATEYGKAYAIRAGRWHYVADYEGRGKLFDVSTDPASLRDRSTDPTAAVPLRYLREAAASFLSGRTRWRTADGSWTHWAPRRARRSRP